MDKEIGTLLRNYIPENVEDLEESVYIFSAFF